MSAISKYSLLKRYNITQPIRMQLSQKQKPFSEWFSAYFKSSLNFEHFEKKKMTLTPYSFLSWRSPKNVVRSMSKKSSFRTPLEKQDGKRFPTLLKSERQHLHHIYWSMGTQLSLRKSLLLICKVLRLFVNTLSAVDKYSLLYRYNITQPIQIQLSQKQKTFSNFFLHFRNAG